MTWEGRGWVFVENVLLWLLLCSVSVCLSLLSLLAVCSDVNCHASVRTFAWKCVFWICPSFLLFDPRVCMTLLPCDSVADTFSFFHLRPYSQSTVCTLSEASPSPSPPLVTESASILLRTFYLYIMIAIIW